MKWLEHRVPPPMVALVVMAAMWIVSSLTPPLPIPHSARLGIAILALALGLGLGAAGVLAFWRAGANIDPHDIERGDKLVTGGVYRFTRNPMYLGVALILFGNAAYLARPLELAGPIVFALYIARFQIMPEERAMLAKFGDAYAAYTLRTRRWL